MGLTGMSEGVLEVSEYTNAGTARNITTNLSSQDRQLCEHGLVDIKVH